jgi:hypothetical protein
MLRIISNAVSPNLPRMSDILSITLNELYSLSISEWRFRILPCKFGFLKAFKHCQEHTLKVPLRYNIITSWSDCPI